MASVRNPVSESFQTRITQLREQHAILLQRSQELLEMRKRTEFRRSEIREQRNRLKAEMEWRRSSLRSAEAAAAAAILDSAVKVSGMKMNELWLGYVSLGGDATPAELRASLAGERPLRRMDHDRLAVVLNERLTESGHGPLLCYWDGSR